LSALGASSRAVDGLGSNARTYRSSESSIVHMTHAAHLRDAVSVLVPARFRSRGSGCRSGWPSYSHRPASIDSSTAHSNTVSLAHPPRNSRYSKIEGQRLAAPRVTDHPRLIGWSSLHRDETDL